MLLLGVDQVLLCAGDPVGSKADLDASFMAPPGQGFPGCLIMLGFGGRWGAEGCLVTTECQQGSGRGGGRETAGGGGGEAGSMGDQGFLEGQGGRAIAREEVLA